jgi:hypothetical protein
MHPTSIEITAKVRLFVVGFGFKMLFGTIVASIGDR